MIITAKRSEAHCDSAKFTQRPLYKYVHANINCPALGKTGIGQNKTTACLTSQFSLNSNKGTYIYTPHANLGRRRFGHHETDFFIIGQKLAIEKDKL